MRRKAKEISVQLGIPVYDLLVFREMCYLMELDSKTYSW